MAAVTLEELRKESQKKNLPRFKAGQTVRVSQKIQEGGKERIQVFQGLIIEISGGQGITGSITVRRIIDGIGVEKVFPLHSPFIEKIELVKEAKVRRSRIFFMRERSGKSARLQERFFSEAELKEMMPHEVTEEDVAEAIEHQKEEEAKKEEENGEASSEIDEKEEEAGMEEQKEETVLEKEATVEKEEVSKEEMKNEKESDKQTEENSEEQKN